jgi:two-component system, OmpR family, copper resistance phosphate regulon response regulator CusR
MRVLIVEDDAELARILTAGLEEQHIVTALAGTYEAGLERAALGTYDVMILDVLLPGGSGFDLCASLRRRGVVTPILMLTAKDAVDDRVRGLEAGADDYLTKPFAFRELLARLGALARRRPTILPEVRRCADLEVDLATRRVRRGETPIELTAKEFALLEVLVANAGVVVDRAAITSYVWDDNHDPFANVLEVLVRRLRRKVDDGFQPPLIHTVRGVGYRFGV